MTAPNPTVERREPGTHRATVAFVCQPMTTLLPIRDSVTIVTTQLADRIRPHIEVVLCGAGGARRTTSRNIDGLDHVLVPTGPDLALHRVAQAVRRRLHLANPRRPFFESWSYYLPYALRVAYELRRRRCDIVHIQTFSHFVPVIRMLNPRAKLVLHMHCEWLSQLDPAVIGPRLERVDLVVSCSDHVTNRAKAAFPHLAARCVTVHNGVAPPEEDGSPVPESARPRLLCVSRVSPEKGVHVLLDAFRTIAAARPDVILDIVGPEHTIPSGYIVDLSDDPAVDGLRTFYDGPSYGDQLRLRIPPGLAGRVSYLGFVPPQDLAAIYRSSAILVHPSLSDSFGMPVVEAMAAGLPVVATRIGGIPEIVDHGTTGLLVPENDPEALAVAVLRLLDDSALALRMGASGRLRAQERFSWERAGASLLLEYEKLLATTTPHGTRTVGGSS